MDNFLDNPILRQSTLMVSALNHITMILSRIDDSMRQQALSRVSGGPSLPVPSHTPSTLAPPSVSPGPPSQPTHVVGQPPVPPIPPRGSPPLPGPPPVTGPPSKPTHVVGQPPVPPIPPGPVPPIPPGPQSPGPPSKPTHTQGPIPPVPPPGPAPGTKAGRDQSSIIMGAIEDAINHLHRTVTGSRFEQQAGGALGLMGGGNLISAAGPVAPVADSLLKVSAAIRSWSNEMHQSNIRFAEFSGPMAGVDIRQQAREIHLARERGGRTAESAEFLAQRSFALEESWAPVEDKWRNISNYAMSAATWLAQTNVEGFKTITGALGIDWDTNKAGAPDNLQAWLLGREDQNWDGFGRPKRLQP